VYVEGAEPGDLLDIEIIDIEPDSYGHPAQDPGFGLLRDDFPRAIEDRLGPLTASTSSARGVSVV